MRGEGKPGSNKLAGMEPTFRQIVELFEAPKAPASLDVDGIQVRKGRTATESQELGRISLNDGDFRSAIRHFKLAVEQRGEPDAEALLGLASAYEYADEHPQAMRQYLRALAAKRDSPEPLLGIAELYKRYGRFKDSIEEYRAAIELEPDNPFLHHKLADALRQMGERTRALAAAQNAVAAKPDDPFFHYWLGDLLIETGRYNEALDALRAAIELSPGDDFLYLRAAVAFWRADRKAEAMKAVRLASDLDPAKNVYHGLLEALLEELGQNEEADLESARADKMDRYDHELLRRVLLEMGIGD